eukprot:Em0005g1259a
MNIDVFEVAVAGNCVAMDCMYRQIVQTTGSYYKVTISSVNDGGVGPESNPVQVGVGVGLPLLIICIALMWAALLGFNHFTKKRQGRYLPGAAENQGTESNAHRKLDDPSTDNVIALTHSNENVTKSRDGCTQSIDGAKLDSLQKTTEVTVQTSFTEHGTIENEKLTTIMQKRIKPVVPLFMVDDTNGFVLEMNKDKVIANAVEDSTCSDQHWYMYVLSPNTNGLQMYIIVTRNGKKALQWNGSALTVNPCDCEDEQQQWTMNTDSFIEPQSKEKPWSMKIKVYPVSIFPVHIRNIQSGSVLELTTKETDVECNPPSEQRSEYHQWHLEFVKGNGGKIFKIISKKNGKALQTIVPLRPADILVPNWSLGKAACFDVSVTSQLNSTIVSEMGVMAGVAASATGVMAGVVPQLLE